MLDASGLSTRLGVRAARATACSTSAAASAATPTSRCGAGPRSSPATSPWPSSRTSPPCSGDRGRGGGDAAGAGLGRGHERRRHPAAVRRRRVRPVIASEVLEHIPDDGAAFAELARVLRPGGTLAVTVPAWLPERICWALSDEYHAPFVEGGHVRIYNERELRAKLRAAGLQPGACPPRPRAAQPVLVAEVRGRADQRQPPARARLPRGCSCGTSAGASRWRRSPASSTASATR